MTVESLQSLVLEFGKCSIYHFKIFFNDILIIFDVCCQSTLVKLSGITSS